MSQTLQIMRMGEQITDLGQENNKLLDVINNQDVKIADLEGRLAQAKGIIKDLINLTEPTSTEEVQHWNETFRKAEQFLRETDITNAIQKANEERRYCCKTCRDLMCSFSGKERYEINCSGVEED